MVTGITVISSYLLAFLVGSIIVRRVTSHFISDIKEKPDEKTLRLGTHIGICESFLIITF